VLILASSTRRSQRLIVIRCRSTELAWRVAQVLALPRGVGESEEPRRPRPAQTEVRDVASGATSRDVPPPDQAAPPLPDTFSPGGPELNGQN
jgi:hypothetical protein